MSEVFLGLVGLSFKASFLIVAVVVLRLALKNAPRRIICVLWLLVGLRLIVPFSLESSLSLVPKELNFERDTAVTETAPAPVITPSVQATPNLSLTTPNIEIDTPNHPLLPTVDAATTVPAIEESQATWGATASIGWLVGLGLMLCYLLLSYILLHRSLREAVPVGEGVWKCAAVCSPFVLGLFRPRVYISYGMSPEQTEYVLAHERSHIVRRDHWTKLLAFLILSVHWFNPFVWLAYILLCRDIELACDERVIRSMDAAERKAYSLALLQCAVKASPLAACPLAFGEVGVKQRIKNVLSYKKPTVWIILAALVCGIAVGVFFLTDPKDDSPSLPPDCPDEVWETISGYLDARCVSAEAAGSYFYTQEDSRYGDETLLLNYEVEYVSKRNELLYSFKWTGEHEYNDSDALYYRKTGVHRNTSSGIYYVFNIDGQWKIASSSGYIPGHILRGSKFDCPDAVMDTFERWIMAMSHSGGSYEYYLELSYFGETGTPISQDAFMASTDKSEIQSITKVNDSLYEIKTLYTLVGWEEEYSGQYFVGYIGDKWYVMLYDTVPESLHEGLEYFEHYTWDEKGKTLILPPLASHSGQSGNVSEFPLTDIYPDTPVGIGVNLIYDDEDTVVFQAKHGLFVYNLAERRMVLAIDTIKAVGIAGYQGSIPVAGVRVSPDGNTIQLYHTSHKEQCFYIDTHTGDYYVAPFEEMTDEDDDESVIERTSFIGSYGITVGCFADQYYCTHSGTGERIPLFSDFPFATTSTPELPVEAHIMDKLRFYLPAGCSTGVYDLVLGAGGGVPIYYADGTLCGQMELNYGMAAIIENGEIVFVDDGMNHASFISGFESIDHSVPCTVAEFSDDNGGHYWYVVFTAKDSDFCYALKLDTDYFSRDEAIKMARAVRFSPEAFNSFNELERVYWSIIDSYAMALSARLLPPEMTEAGLNWAVVDYCEDPLYEAGWAIEDIDGNGKPELLIGNQNLVTEVGTPIFTLYTLDDGYDPTEAFSGFTRSMYYFIKNNYFHHRSSAGVGNSSESYYEYSNGKLTALAEAPDTEVHGVSLKTFSSLTDYGLNSGVQKVYLDWNDPAEYALSNGLELGMSFADITAIMGQPESINAVHDKSVNASMYYLNYYGEATLCLMAELNSPVEDGTLWFAQIYSDSINFGRILSSERSEEHINSLYGIEHTGIASEDEYLPVLRNLSVPTDGYFDSAFDLVPRDESLWEDGPPPCAALLFKDGVLECIYLRYAVAVGFQPTVGAPIVSAADGAGAISFDGTTFYYHDRGLGPLEYELTERNQSINAISSAVSAGSKIVVECYTGAGNNVYCIYDVESQSFEKDIIGSNLTWLGDMLNTAVYSVQSDIYSYDGRLIKSCELKENEFISGLSFSENGSKLIVSISSDSGNNRQDVIEGAIPAPVYTELPGVLSMYLPQGYSLGIFDGRSAAIYDIEGAECGLVITCGRAERELAFSDGSLSGVAKFDGLGFIGDVPIDPRVPGLMYGIAYTDSMSYIDNWYVIYATASNDLAYGLRLSKDFFSEEEARFVAESVEIPDLLG